jgi:hypothetical protein
LVSSRIPPAGTRKCTVIIMKKWKVTLEYNGRTIYITLKASSYADAYIKSELEYPGCVIKSISELRGTGEGY